MSQANVNQPLVGAGPSRDEHAATAATRTLTWAMALVIVIAVLALALVYLLHTVLICQ